MDRLQAMETFVRVIETGSFSGAARSLRLGQPAVSKTITALEARLGVRLLARSTRRVSPTEAGQIFYERAVRTLAEADEAEAGARGAGAGLEGRLRVSAPVTFARLHVAPRLGQFLDAHPRLRLELIMDDRNIDLLAETVDAALRLGDLPDSAGSARRLARTDRAVVASPAYLARRGRPETPADLIAHDAIVYSQAAGGEAWRFQRGAEQAAVDLRSRLSLTASEGVRAAVIAGLGLTVASRWMVAPELASGALVTVLEDWRLPPVDLWAVYPAGRLASAKARTFVTWVETLFEAEA